MAGSLAGPLLGGVLPPLIGFRATFLAAGVVIFIAFLATVGLFREEPRFLVPRRPRNAWFRGDPG
jgi:MFS family permease